MKSVELEIYTKTEAKRARYGIALMMLDKGGGSGYRIVGPKVLGSTPVKSFQLNGPEIDELIKRLQEAKQFLEE